MLKLNVALLAVILCVATVHTANECKGACNYAYVCPQTETVVWATDGNFCHVFRNLCFMKRTNCQRQNDCKPVLERTTKQNCQTMCRETCPTNVNLICGTYKNQRKTFNNQCLLNRQICRTGIPWIIAGNGNCSTIFNNNNSTTTVG